MPTVQEGAKNKNELATNQEGRVPENFYQASYVRQKDSAQRKNGLSVHQLHFRAHDEYWTNGASGSMPLVVIVCWRDDGICPRSIGMLSHCKAE